MSETCSKCSAPIEAGWVVCPDCGAELTMSACEGCGKEMKPNWKACPHCGRNRNDDGIPDLPNDDDLDRADEPSPEQKKRAQRLLGQFEDAITEYARETKYEFGKGLAMLFGGAKVSSIDRCFELRTEIYNAFGDYDDARYEGPVFEMLCSKKKGRDPDAYIDILRNEVRYIERSLNLSAERSTRLAESSNKFICPGCGEKATAKNASLCPTCDQYVHNDCAVKGFIRWSCPVCETGLVGQT